jgi:FkbM family methyltransferase
MKFEKDLGWWFPEGETHLPAWMRSPKGHMVINGRPSYQGRKQIALLAEASQVKGKPLRRIVDVGAHIGLWSFNFAPACSVVEAFEPVLEHRACFERNVLADMKDMSKVNLHACALGAIDGSVRIRTAATSSGDSWVSGPGDIPMLTLDSFAFADVDVIKVDVEGFEENVLRGGMDTLRRCRPVIMVEQKRDMATSRFGLQTLGAVHLLQEIGYRVENELSGDYLMTP